MRGCVAPSGNGVGHKESSSRRLVVGPLDRFLVGLRDTKFSEPTEETTRPQNCLIRWERCLVGIPYLVYFTR